MAERPFIDFYDRLGKVPVKQHNAGSERHFQQRTALYRTLGITPLMVTERKVLEIGPGLGLNALHIASWKPASLTFVDGSQSALKEINRRITSGDYGVNANAYSQDVASSPVKGQYDLVLAEGLIPGQIEPKKFLNNVLNAVTPGGIAVYTTASPISYLAEACRRVLLPIVENIISKPTELNSALVRLFKPGFDSLKGMNKEPEDWVIDNIIHDWTQNGFFSIEDSIKALPENFSYLGASPSFLQDWSWYKQLGDNDNLLALSSYQLWSGYLLDYRSQPKEAFELQEFIDLETLAKNAMLMQNQYRREKQVKYLDQFVDCITEIALLIRSKMPLAAQSIDDFSAGLVALKAGDLSADFLSFHHWFGRGQQYISVVRDYDI